MKKVIKKEKKVVEAVKVELPEKRILRQDYSAYGLSPDSKDNQRISMILDHNRRKEPITMRMVSEKTGDTCYSLFCRLEERGLAYREGKYLYIKEIVANSLESKISKEIIVSRLDANDHISQEQTKKLAEILNTKKSKKTKK